MLRPSPDLAPVADLMAVKVPLTALCVVVKPARIPKASESDPFSGISERIGRFPPWSDHSGRRFLSHRGQYQIAVCVYRVELPHR